VAFRHARPALLLELKTTSGSPGRLWTDERVQAEAYAYALDYMGFDCSSLRLAVVKVRRSGEGLPAALSRNLIMYVTLQVLLNSAEELNRELSRESARVHLLPYDRQSVVEKLRWAKGYWLGEREPVPTKYAGKCRACPYSGRCPYSLAAR